MVILVFTLLWPIANIFCLNSTTTFVFNEKTNGNITIRLPKCCPFSTILSSDGCKFIEPHYNPNFNYPVLMHNETHINTEPLELHQILIDYFFYPLTCTIGRYALESNYDNFALLQNGSLIVSNLNVFGILQQTDFCVEATEDPNTGLISTNIFICAPKSPRNIAMLNIYLTLNLISIMCCIGASFMFYFVLQCKEIHKRCFVGFSLTMSITFLCVIVMQMSKLQTRGCLVLGFIFQFFVVASYTWLAILCYDVLSNIQYFEVDTHQKMRMTYYVLTSLTISSIALLISLRNVTPDVPDSFLKLQFRGTICSFADPKERVIIFYVTTCILISMGLVFLILAQYKIRKLDSDKMNRNYCWILFNSYYKFMFRQCAMIWIIITICWLMELTANILHFSHPETGGSVYNCMIILESLQGVFIVMIFGLHHYGTVYFMKRNKTSEVEMVHLTTSVKL